MLSIFSKISTKTSPKRFLFCQEGQKLYRLVAGHHDSTAHVSTVVSTLFPLQVVELLIAQMDSPTFLELGVSGSSSLWSKIFYFFFFLKIEDFFLSLSYPQRSRVQ